MRGAIQSGLYSENKVVSDLQPTCSSGNCTWPNYHSLAICARSADVTSHLQSKSVTIPGDYPGAPKQTALQWYLSQQNYLIDNVYTLSNVGSVAKKDPIMSSDQSYDRVVGYETQSVKPIALNFTDSIAFKDSALPVADVFMIYTNIATLSGNDKGNFSAIEFVLEWCVQGFDTAVANGLASTQRLDSFRNFSQPDPSQDSAILQAKPINGQDQDYQIDPSIHYNLQVYFQGLFQGTAYQTNVDGLTLLSVTNDATQALYQPFNIVGEKVNGVDEIPGRGVGPAGLQAILENTATGMTNM